ncbi:unnamed protein product, partial [Iphiclides podalirius]
MSSEESTDELKAETTQVIYKCQDEADSEEVSMSEWSSLVEELPEENVKRKLYAEGLYEPGSGEICTKYVAMSASSVIRHPFYNYPAVLDPGIKEAILDPEDKVVYPNDGQKLYLAICKEMNQCPVKSFHEGLIKEVIDLRYYNVNPNGVKAMAKALEHNRNVTALDLTDNFLNDDACYHLSEMLVTNSVLKDLNLTGCRIGPSGVKQLMFGLPLNRSLRVLNLSKNQIGDEGIKYLAESIHIKEAKEYLVVTYGDVLGDYKVAEPDLRDIVLNRADFLVKKRKKRSSVDIALLAMQLLKDNYKVMSAKAFGTAIENSGLVLDEDLVNGIVEVFAGPKSKKAKTIDITLLVDFVKRKWPDRQLPPTPPPEPEPETQIEPEPIPEVKPAKSGKKKNKK